MGGEDAGVGAVSAARRRPGARRREAAGFTLLELVVATGLTLLALAVAARLLGESHRMLALAAHEQLDPVAGLALAQLRADLQGAGAVAGAPYPRLEAAGPLVLLGHPAGTIRYELGGGDLVRTLLDAAGRPQGRRVVLRGATAWSWAQPSPGLVAVEIGFPRHATPLIHAAAGPLPVRHPSREERLAVTVALRGGVRVQAW